MYFVSVKGIGRNRERLLEPKVRRSDKWLHMSTNKVGLVYRFMTWVVHEAGKMANWIAPPHAGIKGRPLDFEYVRL